MGPLKRLLSRPVPDKLYHYTSQAGLLGIVEARRIWASKINFLNDTAELALALQTARQAVLLASPPRRIRNALLDKLGLMSAGGINIFVCSFSRHRDQLSQWRGYTEPGGGYSIGFEGPKLKSLAVVAGFSLGPCSYVESTHRAIVGDIVSGALDAASHLPSPPPAAALSHLAHSFGQELYFAAPFLKHRAYKEEAEWRLVSPPTVFGHPNINYRAGRSHLVPYFAFDLSTPTSDALPIADVVVGPTPQPLLATDAIEDLFTSKGLLPCSFSASAIPFRRW